MKAAEVTATARLAVQLSTVALVEPARGLEECLAIADEVHVAGPMFGSHDYGPDIDAAAGLSCTSLPWAHSPLVNVAAEAGNRSLPGRAIPDLEEASAARAIEYSRNLCIDTNRRAAVRGIFTPSPEQFHAATEIMHAVEPGDVRTAIFVTAQIAPETAIARPQMVPSEAASLGRGEY